MRHRLSTAESQLLGTLAAVDGATDEAALDATALAALERRGFVRRASGFVVIRDEGRALLEERGSAAPRRGRRPSARGGTGSQAPGDESRSSANALTRFEKALLRHLHARGGAAARADFDPALIRRLEARGLLQSDGADARITAQGTALVQARMRTARGTSARARRTRKAE